MFVAEFLHSLADGSMVDMARDPVVIESNYEVDIPFFDMLFEYFFDERVIPPLSRVVLEVFIIENHAVVVADAERSARGFCFCSAVFSEAIEIS